MSHADRRTLPDALGEISRSRSSLRPESLSQLGIASYEFVRALCSAFRDYLTVCLLGFSRGYGDIIQMHGVVSEAESEICITADPGSNS